MLLRLKAGMTETLGSPVLPARAGVSLAKNSPTAVALSAPSLDLQALPRAVARIRRRILQSVARGDIADLLIPIQWNEVPPLFMRDQPQIFDPVAYLKRRSFDGEGREMLRIAGAILRQPYTIETHGQFRSIQWPSFPVVPEIEPTVRENLAPWRCTRFEDAIAPGNAGPKIHRISIGLDCTWHFFWPDRG